MICNESNYLILLSLVGISALAGRLSLWRNKYTGWCVKFYDSSKLVSLIQNAVLFFISALFCLFLLFSTPDTLRREAPALGAVFLLYLAEILIFFCCRRLRAFFGRCGKLVARFFRWIFRKGPAQAPASADQVTQLPMPQSGATPRSMLLRFLSVFNLFFAISAIVFLLAMLIVESVDKAWTFADLFRRSQEQSLIAAYHSELLLPLFLLSLTTATGALLAAVDFDYRWQYTRQRAQRNLEELGRRVRAR